MVNLMRSLVIVGGGSSAWLTAAYISHNSPNIKITVIDKEIGNPVGVGEGTTLAFPKLMQDSGFDQAEWMMAVDATYKSAIVFPGWGSADKEIWHPFFLNQILEDGKTSLLEVWSKNQHYDYRHYGSMLYDTSINHNKVDLYDAGAYAFHVDCGKLVQYIQKKLENKITFIKSEVVAIQRNGDLITNLTLKDGQNITGDLYVDCTGFKGMLKENPKRVDLKGRLFCDTAVAGHIPYISREEEMRPYVVSEAVACGWIWDIPVQTRIGSGLVFNREITDIEEAKDFFCQYWNNRITKDKLKVLMWDPYYNEDFWKGNVVSIGLSAGFIEPLESTGLALISAGIVKLEAKIRDNTWSKNDADYYSLDMKLLFEDCVDFISMHYSRNTRPEKFWKFVQETYKPSDKILAYAELMKDSIRLHRNAKDFNIFSGANWTCWMAQLGYPVGAANDGYSQQEAKKIMLKYYNGVEKFRHNHSRHHATEIDRLRTYYNINQD
jgi:tryptophan halogenase